MIQHAAQTERLRRVAVGFDGARVTGIGLWRVTDRLTVGRSSGAAELLGLCRVDIDAAGWREADSIDLVDALLEDASGGEPIEWAAAVEDVYQPRPEADGKFLGRPPTAARKHWLRVVDHLARVRAKRLGVPFRKPRPFSVKASSWRKTLGVDAYVCRYGGDTKTAAVAFLREVLGLEVPEHNTAEGVLLAHYLARVAHVPRVPKLKGPLMFVR